MKIQFWYLVSLLVTLMLSCSSLREDVRIPLVKLAKNEVISTHQASADKAMVVSQGIHSSAAGLEILKLGGNAADAAVAVGFAISVERPQSTGLGGGGFLLSSTPKAKIEAWDFRETAPGKIKASDYLKADGSGDYDKSQIGALAVGTPGLVAGLKKFHDKYGKLPWEKLLQPAIKLAEEGFIIYPELAIALEKKQTVLKSFPSSEKIFFDEKGEVLKEGHLLIQKDLAKTLRLIAKKGAKDFYQGSIAQKIVSTIKQHQGVLKLSDLKNYQVKNRIPVHTKLGDQYFGVDIYSMPPPSSGGIHVIQILNFLESAKLLKPWHVDSIHQSTQAMQQAFFDRALYLGDPDFVKVPTQQLVDKEYAQKVFKSFTPLAKKQADLNFTISEGKSFETTHYAVIDDQGFVVSSTQTINGYFGSGLVAEGTGIMLNNEMDDFALTVGGSNLFGAYGGSKNLVQPFKRPLSSMSPTIVLKNGKPFLTLGSPSGTRIITCVAQTLLNYLHYQLPLYDSVAMMRYHHQWSPDELWLEEGEEGDAMAKELEKKNYKVVRKDLGCKVQAIAKTEKGLVGVSDPRGQGSVVGY